MNQPQKTPDANHPISIVRNPNRVVVTVAGKVVADTTHALTLEEDDYPPVHYIPREAARMSLLEPAGHTSHSPYKGDASYFNIPSGGDRSTYAAWTYESPYPAVTAIKDHLAFHPDRVDSIEEHPPE